MKIRVLQFVEFAYGDKRKDKSKVSQIINDNQKDYDPVTDRYKRFRESLSSFEDGNISENQFKNIYKTVTANKVSGYKILAENYLDLKEDHGLVWDGRQGISIKLDELEITANWYLHTDSSNQKRIVFLNFRKEPLPQKHEKGILNLLRASSPDFAGVGVLNVQAATLILATRLNVKELEFLELRAKTFLKISDSI